MPEGQGWGPVSMWAAWRDHTIHGIGPGKSFSLSQKSTSSSEPMAMVAPNPSMSLFFGLAAAITLQNFFQWQTFSKIKALQCQRLVIDVPAKKEPVTIILNYFLRLPVDAKFL